MPHREKKGARVNSSCESGGFNGKRGQPLHTKPSPPSFPLSPCVCMRAWVSGWKKGRQNGWQAFFPEERKRDSSIIQKMDKKGRKLSGRAKAITSNGLLQKRGVGKRGEDGKREEEKEQRTILLDDAKISTFFSLTLLLFPFPFLTSVPLASFLLLPSGIPCYSTKRPFWKKEGRGQVSSSLGCCERRRHKQASSSSSTVRPRRRQRASGQGKRGEREREGREGSRT